MPKATQGEEKGLEVGNDKRCKRWETYSHSVGDLILSNYASRFHPTILNLQILPILPILRHPNR